MICVGGRGQCGWGRNEPAWQDTEQTLQHNVECIRCSIESNVPHIEAAKPPTCHLLRESISSTLPPAVAAASPPLTGPRSSIKPSDATGISRGPCGGTYIIITYNYIIMRVLQGWRQQHNAACVVQQQRAQCNGIKPSDATAISRGPCGHMVKVNDRCAIRL
jgi:hypothetical protein